MLHVGNISHTPWEPTTLIFRRCITDGSYYSTMGFPDSYVQRLGLSEIRVLTIHVNSKAFHHSIQRVRQLLRSIYAKAIMSLDFFSQGISIYLPIGNFQLTLVEHLLEVWW